MKQRSFLERLGIFGWTEEKENKLLASLLTGDPLLLIAKHGTAKTGMTGSIGKALNVPFIGYDASKALFEDVLGFPNIKKLQQGTVEYIKSKITIFDKQFVLIDELNRALPEMQSKWLEIIRSRKIMGLDTDVKWVWAAMNPVGYEGTNMLDEALVGRFAFFVYPPEALDMSVEDRAKVAGHVNGDDALALDSWVKQKPATITDRHKINVGKDIMRLLRTAGRHYLNLTEEVSELQVFLSRFATLLSNETKAAINLDGRRLGFMYRNIIAVRAIERAKAGLFNTELSSFVESARSSVLASIPYGINDESVNKESLIHIIETVFELLSEYFKDDSDIDRINLIYELFTTEDMTRRVEILLCSDLNEMIKTKAWNDLVKNNDDISPVAYAAIKVEVEHPGTIPKEMIDHLCDKIQINDLISGSIESLKDLNIDHIEELEQLIDQSDELSTMVAINTIRDHDEKNLNIKELKKDIDHHIQQLKRLTNREAV
ncbi:MAG: AAA family ATPase [Methanosarcinaceae archaeon]